MSVPGAKSVMWSTFLPPFSGAAKTKASLSAPPVRMSSLGAAVETVAARTAIERVLAVTAEELVVAHACVEDIGGLSEPERKIGSLVPLTRIPGPPRPQS